MAKKVQVDGVALVMNNLKKELKNIKGKTLKGMIKASVLVRRTMDDKSPTIPIDTGNLRASWYTVTSTGGEPEPGGPFKGKDAAIDQRQHTSVMGSEKAAIASQSSPNLSMGFTANYAAAVHEMEGANFKRPGSGPFFFSSAIRGNQRQILKVIAETAKIPRQ